MMKTLPQARGRYRENADLSKSNWFRVGGAAQVLFKPEDAEDLAFFLKYKPAELPVHVIGVGSNLVVRDGGLDGVTIRLGRGFAKCERVQNAGLYGHSGPSEGADGGDAGSTDSPQNASNVSSLIYAGAGCLDINVAQTACEAGLAGLEFLSGIPGTIGGALAMNAGAYGSDIAEILVEVEGVDAQGNLYRVSPEQFSYGYRTAKVPDGWIFTGAWLRGTAGDKAEIMARMQQIQKDREASQPIRSRTGGSTFKNPEGHKAWQLVDEAGCRGLRVGDAEMSEKHCNFMINHGNATAADLEKLGEEVRARVLAKTGVQLEWEIRRVGKTA